MPRLSDPGGAPCIYAVNAGHYCLPLRSCVDFWSVSATLLLILADHNYTIFRGSMTQPACSKSCSFVRAPFRTAHGDSIELLARLWSSVWTFTIWVTITDFGASLLLPPFGIYLDAKAALLCIIALFLLDCIELLLSTATWLSVLRQVPRDKMVCCYLRIAFISSVFVLLLEWFFLHNACVTGEYAPRSATLVRVHAFVMLLSSIRAPYVRHAHSHTQKILDACLTCPCPRFRSDATAEE